jgi:hypothetical protein
MHPFFYVNFLIPSATPKLVLYLMLEYLLRIIEVIAINSIPINKNVKPPPFQCINLIKAPITISEVANRRSALSDRMVHLGIRMHLSSRIA